MVYSRKASVQEACYGDDLDARKTIREEAAQSLDHLGELFFWRNKGIDRLWVEMYQRHNSFR